MKEFTKLFVYIFLNKYIAFWKKKTETTKKSIELQI